MQRSSGQARSHSSRPTVHRVMKLVNSKRRRCDHPERDPPRTGHSTKTCQSADGCLLVIGIQRRSVVTVSSAAAAQRAIAAEPMKAAVADTRE